MAGGSASTTSGCRQNRLLSRVCGALLNFAAACLALSEFKMSGDHLTLPLGDYFGSLVQSAAAIFSARTLQINRAHLGEPESFVRDVLY